MSPFGRTQVQRRALHQLHSVEGRAKCPTVPQCREPVTGRRIAGQGST